MHVKADRRIGARVKERQSEVIKRAVSIDFANDCYCVNFEIGQDGWRIIGFHDEDGRSLESRRRRHFVVVVEGNQLCGSGQGMTLGPRPKADYP